ncbi:MAG: putative anti-sigma-YlaC factor YlaD [Myxococcota bacterium]|jgi:predicted anti-sigma-YlaC factor YlaD
MNQHVPEDLLAAFVEADVSEQLAVHIAEHLDSCPACNARAANLEPLASAFAAVDDPALPSDLVASILAAAARPEPAPLLEVGLGASLLAIAAMLVLAFGNPLGMAADLGLVMHAAAGLGRGLAVGIGSSSPAVFLTLALGALGAAVVWRLAETEPFALTPIGRHP